MRSNLVNNNLQNRLIVFTINQIQGHKTILSFMLLLRKDRDQAKLLVIFMMV